MTDLKRGSTPFFNISKSSQYRRIYSANGNRRLVWLWSSFFQVKMDFFFV